MKEAKAVFLKVDGESSGGRGSVVVLLQRVLHGFSQTKQFCVFPQFEEGKCLSLRFPETDMQLSYIYKTYLWGTPTRFLFHSLRRIIPRQKIRKSDEWLPFLRGPLQRTSLPPLHLALLQPLGELHGSLAGSADPGGLQSLFH